MKLQKRFLRKVKEKDYYKYIVQLSQRKIKEAGFKADDELEADARKGEIRLRKT